MAYQDDVLKTLRSIDATLKAMLEIRRGAATQVPDTRRAGGQGTTSPGAVASDRDLDSKWGDPVIKAMPKAWKGKSFKGQPMSRCPAELLDGLAEMYDWFANKAEKNHEVSPRGKPIADYKRLDAARARGWAKRIRAGKVAPATDSASTASGAPAEFDSDWATTSEF
jgi:hypothetical protein